MTAEHASQMTQNYGFPFENIFYEQKVARYIGSIAGQSLHLGRTRLLRSIMGADVEFTDQI